MKLTPLKAIRKHQPRLGVESRQVVWNVPDMKRNKSVNVRIKIVCYSLSGKVLIQIVKAAQLRIMALQRQVLKKLMIMYRWGEFVLKMNGEGEEIWWERKREHTHGGLRICMKKSQSDCQTKRKKIIIQLPKRAKLFLF